MSSLYVRQFAKTWAQSLTSPFYNTINEDQNPNDTVWLSIDFNSYTTVKATYCSEWIEQGTINLVFFGRPGIGDDGLIAIAEQDAKTFFNNVDATGKLTLTVLNAPIEFGSSDTPFFGVEVGIDYEYVF